jgi:serine phosphatase RsbU (regulator of sigma subunit)
MEDNLKPQTSNMELLWAGANNPLWIYSNNSLTEIKADKQPIGKFINSKPFTSHKINLQKEDLILLFTDGFSDQFGGPNNKKMKISRLKELFLANQALNAKDQIAKFSEFFEDWKVQYQQTDDVCVLALRV